MMNGYSGIDHTNNNFNVFAVTLQTILSNWLGPVWWSLASLRMLLAWLDNQDDQIAPYSTSKTVIPGGAASNSVTNEHRNPVSGRESKPNINHNSSNTSATHLDPASSSSIEPNSKRPVQVQHRRPFFEALTFQTAFTATSSLAVMLACIRSRNDDPVLWTVLAPRYVNTVLRAVFHHLMINVGLCTGLWSAVVR